MFSGWADTISKGLDYFFLPFEFPVYFGKLVHLILSQRSLPRELIRLKKHLQWFKNKNFKTIIDVGANTGPFAFAARVLLPDVHIYAFEPLPDCYEKLLKNLTHYGQFDAFNSAVGEKTGEIWMWRSDFSESSSLLAMGDLHKRTFPHTAKTNSIKVMITRLDDMLEKLHLESPVLLKIDVQGYEDKVIKGAERTLKKVDWIITELSYQSLYEGQALFEDVYQLLINSGFRFAGNMDALYSPLDGNILQSDGIFYKK
jgi:FkbM family methyltransferase